MNPNNYVHKDGIYLEESVAKARRLSGDRVQPHTTPEALASKVLGISAERAAEINEETDREWEVARRHDITVMFIRREARPPEPSATRTSSLDDLRRVAGRSAGYDCRCRFKPGSVDSKRGAIDAINRVMNSIRERGYFEVNGEPVSLGDGHRSNDVPFNIHIGSARKAAWIDGVDLPYTGHGFHVRFQREGNTWRGYDDASDMSREQAVNLIRYAFIDALHEHEIDPHWAWRRVR